jgi:hypothetical protein
LHKLDHVLVYDATGTTASFTFVCTDACRLVYQASLGVYSWDGTGQPAKLWANNRRADTGGALVGVAPIGGHLAFGRYANKTPNAPDQGQRLTTLLGDARGHNLRPVAGLDVPMELPDGPMHVFAALGTPTTLLTPAGLVAFALFVSDRVRGGSRLLGALIHT